MCDRRKAERRSEKKTINFRDRRRFDRRMDIEALKKIIFAKRPERSEKNRRVVITGIGVVAPNGIGKDQFWECLSNGVSGIKPISLFDTGRYHSKKAGEVANFKPKDYLKKKGLRTLDRSTLLLAVANKLALEDSKTEITQENTYETGMVTGTTMGSVKSISDFDMQSLVEGPSYVNPALFPNTVINSPSSHVSIIFDIRGLNATISSGFCSALDAAIYAYDAIILNRANMIFVGSVEELCHQTFLGFYKGRCLARQDNKAGIVEDSRPFDKKRNGMVLGEGAGVLVFEELEHARQRDACIYGEILGFGRAFDPASGSEGYNPLADGARSAMEKALKASGLAFGAVDLICSGANASPAGDEIETIAIKKVFGKHAYDIPITAVKSMLGEGYSVSGGFQMIAALLSINKGIIPPTINHLDADPRCDLDYVTDRREEERIDRVMANSFSPHGNNVSMIIGSYRDQ